MRHLAPSGEILFSLWPDHTRPSAPAERAALFELLARFGRFSLLADELKYRVPLFEQKTMSQEGAQLPEWRFGDIVRFRPNDAESNLQWRFQLAIPASTWVRFTAGLKQLAVRIRPDTGPFEFFPVGGKMEWRLDSVSRRATARSLVDIWSSDGFVATAPTSVALISQLTLACAHAHSRAQLLDARVRDLLECAEIDVNMINEPNWIQIEWTFLD